MLKEEQPKKEENHEEDTQETESSINKEDTSIEEKNMMNISFLRNKIKLKTFLMNFIPC